MTIAQPPLERQYRVIFRACDAVRAVNAGPRPFGLDKTTLVKICFLSLYDSIRHYRHSIHILGDRLSEDLLEFFRRFPVTVTNGELGVAESIRQSIRLALGYGDKDWAYFCEDDYLHRPEAWPFIADLIDQRESVLSYWSRSVAVRLFVRGMNRKPLFIHPPDYPDRYRIRDRRFSLVFVSRHCHWRQITDTTHTFLAEVASLKRYRAVLERSADPPDDGALSRLYGGVRFGKRGLCVCPIPGLSTHMHEDTMTPLVDWEAIHLGARARLREIEGEARTA